MSVYDDEQSESAQKRVNKEGQPNSSENGKGWTSRRLFSSLFFIATLLWVSLSTFIAGTGTDRLETWQLSAIGIISYIGVILALAALVMTLSKNKSWWRPTVGVFILVGLQAGIFVISYSF